MTPILLFKNIITEDNVDITGFVSPNDIEGALSFLTFEYWEFSQPETLLVQIEDSGLADSLGIFGDGLIGVDVTVSYSQDAENYTIAHEGTITQDGATLFLFSEAINAAFFKIEFEVGTGAECKIRNLSLGESLPLERCLQAPFSPSPYNRQSQLISSGSGEAQFKSKRFSYQGFSTQINLTMMSSGWARAEFQEFVNHALRSAYFFSWNPEDYPSEAIFGWTDEDIPLSYTGDAALMESSWTVKR
jgi:hypothetical protein